jgi:hypothetical protein
LAWVHSTPFGRAVVPDVYCTLPGAIGSCGRRGRAASSPSSESNEEARSGLDAGAAPASCAVTAIQFKRPQWRLTSSP